MKLYLQIITYVILSIGFSSDIFSQNFEFEELKEIPGAYITSIQELSTGDIIITTPQGVWKGNPSLSEWRKISSGIADSAILCSAIGTNDMIFVGTPSGVYKSSNIGLQWIKTGNNFSSKEVRHLSVHPNGTVYAGVHKRLYRSKDNGNTWQVFADSIMKLYDSKAQYGISHYGTNNRIFVLMHYTDDDGETWKESLATPGNKVQPHPEITEGYVLNYMTGGNGYIYISYNDSTGGNHGSSTIEGFFVSTDNGVSWGEGFYNEGREKGISKEATKEQYHNFLYLNSNETQLRMLSVGNDTLIFFPYQGLPIIARPIVSKVGSYLSVGLDYSNKKIEGLTSTEIVSTKILRDGRLIVGTYGGGLFYSDNKGLKWNKVQLPIYYPILTCYAHNDSFQKSYLGTTNGLFEYDRVQKSWKEIALKDSNSKFIADIAIRPTDGTLFILVKEGIYQKESDKWKMIYSHKEQYTCRDMLFYGDTMMIETNLRSYYSKDFTTWNKYTVLAQELTGGGLFSYYNKKYAYPFTIYPVFTGYYSKIYGNVLLEAGLPIFRIATGSTGKKIPAYVFAVTEGNNNDDFYIGNEAGVFKLDILSEAWVQDKKTGLLKDRVLALASNQMGEVFAGALTGAFHSTDKALTWSALPQFPTKAVRSLAIDHEGYIYAGLAWGGIYKSKQSSVQLSAPELTIPAHKSTEIKLKSDATWKAVKYATGYHIQIAEDSTFTNLTVNDSTLGVNVKPMTGNISVNSTYYWRVRGTFGNFRGTWSEIRTFTTETVLPEKLQLSKPTDKSENVSLLPLLQWSTSLQAEQYHIQLSTEQDFTAPLVNDSMVTISERIIDNVSSGTEYFWRVRGRNKAGYGIWSDIWSFRTRNINSIEKEQTEQLTVTIDNTILTIYNNPYKHSISTVSLTDINGKKIYGTRIEKGTETIQIALDSIVDGYYVITLESKAGTIHTQTIIRR